MAKEMDCQWNEGNSVNQADVGPMISKIGPDFHHRMYQNLDAVLTKISTRAVGGMWKAVCMSCSHAVDGVTVSSSELWDVKIKAVLTATIH